MSVNPPPGPPTDRILRAILSTVVAMACFAVLNAMSKTLSTSGYPVIEVIWARYFFAFLFMLAMFLPRSGRRLFAIRRLDTQVVRGLLLFFSSTCSSTAWCTCRSPRRRRSRSRVRSSSPHSRRACSASRSARAAGRRWWWASSAR
jgi:hypothetical protein